MALYTIFGPLMAYLSTGTSSHRLMPSPCATRFVAFFHSALRSLENPGLLGSNSENGLAESYPEVYAALGASGSAASLDHGVREVMSSVSSPSVRMDMFAMPESSPSTLAVLTFLSNEFRRSGTSTGRGRDEVMSSSSSSSPSSPATPSSSDSSLALYLGTMRKLYSRPWGTSGIGRLVMAAARRAMLDRRRPSRMLGAVCASGGMA
mmetsp:Transcript_23375/g.73160  ORF Transcript_23375/g.73160 Transcript_23375/m.73160 type:complete len:207 (+) Transcript_23375:2511-3131(+)